MSAISENPVRLLVFAVLVVSGLGLLMLASCRSSPVIAGGDGARLRFPSVSGSNLLKEPVRLPDDLAGSPALVLVAFKQRQQLEVNTWLANEDRIEKLIPGVQIIETPTISSARWGLLAWWIDNGMRSGIQDEQARRRTVTLYTNVRAFREALGLETDQTPYAVLLDPGGNVLAIEAGAFDEQKLDRMLEAAREARLITRR